MSTTILTRARSDAIGDPDGGDLPMRSPVAGAPALLGLGTALPPLARDQDSVAREMADLWSLSGAALERWRRIVRGAGVETRHGVMEMRNAVRLSTAERMRAYERHAPPLAAAAARDALAASGVAAPDVTDLIVVSCTGFSAPGVDAALVGLLGLSPRVRRTVIGFMGCFGAITGLRAAVGACSADPRAIALVVCVELCSLHIRAEPDVENQVASALFADGAAAAVVVGDDLACATGGLSTRVSHVPCATGGLSTIALQSGGHSDDRIVRSPLGRLTPGASLIIPEGADWMTWRITDSGFAMTLSRDVPAALRERLRAFVDALPGPTPASFIVHPGGPGILDAVDDALRPDATDALAAAREVLRLRGNMSSGTVLFVLAEALRRGCALPALLLAFGPGLTIESIPLLPAHGD